MPGVLRDESAHEGFLPQLRFLDGVTKMLQGLRLVLLGQRRPDEVAKLRGKKAEDITPPGLLAAYNTTENLRAVPNESK